MAIRQPVRVTFHLAVTLQMVLGILWATVMGILGGIIPAIRAARVLALRRRCVPAD
jgi:hypothetical protein